MSYNNTITTSNIVTGEVLEVLSATKNSLNAQYSYNETITYVISINNTGVTAFNNLTITDDLGAYTIGGLTVTPLTYEPNTVSYYVNGVLQTTPVVTAGPPLVISNINVPAGGNAIILYEARVNQYAPLAVGSTIVNNAEISSSGLTNPIEVSNTVTVTDIFNPIIDNITVTLNGTILTSPAQYSYDDTTGVFQTVPGVITVPAATFTQDAVTGQWNIIPGVTVLSIIGTV